MTKSVVSGNRIVDMQYYTDTLNDLQYNHSRICTSGKLILHSENRIGLGLNSHLTFICTMCEKTYMLYTR